MLAVSIRSLHSHFRDAQSVSITLTCEPSYQAWDQKVECLFTLFNSGEYAIFVSKWLTPFEGMDSNFLRVKRNEIDVPYDGRMVHRSFPPPPESYIPIFPKDNVSTTFDLSKSYRIDEPGEYTVSVYVCPTYYSYVESFHDEDIATVSLQSKEVRFLITERAATPRLTTGDINRKEETSPDNAWPSVTMGKTPLMPFFTGTALTAERAALITDIHIAVYHYANASALEVMDDEYHFRTWFGDDLSKRDYVRKLYLNIVQFLEENTVLYVIFGLKCQGKENAYVFRTSKIIYLCPRLFELKNIAPNDQLVSILSVIVHQLTHVVNGAAEICQGPNDCKVLARVYPKLAAVNADSYALFTSTTYPFNFGIDAMTVLPNGGIYITKENFYAKLNGQQEPFTLKTNNYPELINRYWGVLPPPFIYGFDSIFRCAKSKFTYATKGPKYVRYSDKNARKIDAGYPKPIKGNFGSLEKQFLAGFDSATRLPNGVTCVTRGNVFVVYKDSQCQNISSNRPLPIAGNWGRTTPTFNEGFDSMMTTESRLTFVTKGKQYIRYSDPSAQIIDYGYPRNIRGNFGVPKSARFVERPYKAVLNKVVQ